MVFVRIFCIIVSSETFIWGIICMIGCLSVPSTTTFNTKVVVEILGQCTLTGSTFEYTLSQSYAGRNTVSLHLVNSHIAIFIEIVSEQRTLGMDSGTTRY